MDGSSSNSTQTNEGPDEGPSSLMYHTDPEVTATLARIEQMCGTLVQNDSDKETRLRSLEKWRWVFAGGLLALGGKVSGVLAWLK